MDSVTGHPYNFHSTCIICCEKIESRHQTPSNEHPISHLTDLFLTFCKYNSWEYKLEYNFECEAFPFCDTCMSFTLQIFQLDQNIETILTQIRQIVTKVSAKIVSSEGHKNKGDFIGTSQVEVKNQYYRNITLNQKILEAVCNPEVGNTVIISPGENDQSKVVTPPDLLTPPGDVPSLELDTTSQGSSVKGDVVIKEEHDIELPLSDQDLSVMPNDYAATSLLLKSLESSQDTLSLDNEHPSHSSPSKTKGNKCVRISATKYVYAGQFPFEEIGNRFQCGSCSFYTLKKRCNLLQHIRSNHMTNGNQKHVCGTCGKSYSNKICFKFHLETHSDTPCYSCEFCGKQFKLIYNYRSHKRYSHGGDSLKKYECEFCSKRFWKKREMVLHAKIHTEDVFSKTNCLVCGEIVEMDFIEVHMQELHSDSDHSSLHRLQGPHGIG